MTEQHTEPPFDARKRPAWTNTLRRYLSDDVLDDPSYESPEHDDMLEEIEAAVGGILCRTYGHDVINDQCMIPDHRYCFYCGQRIGALAIREGMDSVEPAARH
jgi:hypothetical protein